MSGDRRYAEIALPIPRRQAFTYALGKDAVEPGARVLVPFGPRRVQGVVLEVHDRAPSFDAKPILATLDPEPLFSVELLRHLVEAADYYFHPIGEVLKSASPALRSERLRELESDGLFDAHAPVRGARVKTATEHVARLGTAAEEGVRLGEKQREVLALVATRTEIRLPEIESIIPSGRTVARRLAARGLLTIEEREVVTDRFFARPSERDEAPALHPEQRAAVDAIDGALTARRAQTFLLHGVTGSGKTEVYLHAIATARDLGRGALVLVPEIALTPQLVGRFRARFGDEIAVLHSALTDKERALAWRALRSGRVRLAIGARSALFAPVTDLGIIIADEEHDPSYKQEEGFRYHARDLAVLRATRADAVCVLGSATPSLETFERARRGAYVRLAMPTRATAHTLPAVELIDLSRTGAGPSRDPLLSLPLHRALERTLESGHQAILFLNRRGFAPSLRCTACGKVPTCPACSVALTEHRRARVLRCHYCDFAAPLTEACPSCGSLALEPLGLGTEKLESTLATSFPAARIARLDRDTAIGDGVEEVLDRMRRREVDILVGTQMVTKGHDLPGVTTVGVVLADQSLYFPDVRASERTFQLLAQVAGRAGRGEVAGRVLIQTYQPQHHAIRTAVHHDYLGFAEIERVDREDLRYPPFGRLIAVRIDAADEAIAKKVAARLAYVAREAPRAAEGTVEVLGPVTAPIAKVRGRYRERFLLKSTQRPALREVAARVVAAIEAGIAPARAHVDVDPISML